MPLMDKLTIGLVWMSYLMIGFFWHDQFLNQVGMIYAGLLFLLPNISSTSSQSANEAIRRPHPAPFTPVEAAS